MTDELHQDKKRKLEAEGGERGEGQEDNSDQPEVPAQDLMQLESLQSKLDEVRGISLGLGLGRSREGSM